MIHPHLINAWLHATAAKDRRPVYVWARDNVQLFPPLTRTGFFDVSGSRHFIAPFDALQSDHVREVNVAAPVRSGKSLIGDVWLPWTVLNDPGSFRVVMQDDQIAHEQAESRIFKTLKATPGINLILPTDKHKNREMELILPTGHNLYIGGPALGKLQSKGFRYIWVSEAWLPQISKMMAQIKGRLKDFQKMGIEKLFCEGQGGEDGDPWDLQLKNGEQNEWTIECQKCGHFMQAEFSGVRQDGSRWGMVWDNHRDSRGLWEISKVLPSIRFECQQCGHPHIDTQKLKENWNRTGKYQVIGETNPRKKTFHWNFIIDSPWQPEIESWLEARNAWKQTRDIVPTVAFWQKRCAVPKSQRTAQESSHIFKRDVYEILDEYPGEVARFVTIDRQSEDLFWVTIRVWIVIDGQLITKRLWFGKCFSFIECDAKREEFKVPSNWVLIDSGYRAKGDQGVYAACVKYGWTAVKGVGGVSHFTHSIKLKQGGSKRVFKCYAPLSQGDTETAAGYCSLIRFSDQSLCDKLNGLVESGVWIEPQVNELDPMEVAYKKQMSAVAQVPDKDKYGNTIFTWQTLDDDNHAWDVNKFQVLAAILTDIIPDPFEFAESKETETTNK